MKNTLKNIISRYPSLHRIARKVRANGFLLPQFRLVMLSSESLTETHLEPIKNDAQYNDIMNDLIAYTGFSAEKLQPYLLRIPEKHFKSEINWYAPKDEQELTWFYRISEGYLFANAVHPYDSTLDIIKKGKILDYGAGTGCNTIGLAKKGFDVDFLEICRVQADFINFRAERHKLNNIREVRPYREGKFDPVLCIEEQYDTIVAMDVLEHIPNYHIVVKHFIEQLKPGGTIIENSPFDPLADEIAIHVRPSIPLEKAMVGMERIDTGIWKKKS